MRFFGPHYYIFDGKKQSLITNDKTQNNIDNKPVLQARYSVPTMHKTKREMCFKNTPLGYQRYHQNKYQSNVVFLTFLLQRTNS